MKGETEGSVSFQRKMPLWQVATNFHRISVCSSTMRVQKTVFISNSASSRLASATHGQEMSNTKSAVSMPLLSCFSTSASGSNKFEKSTSNKGKPKCGFDSIDDALILFDQLLHSCPRPPMIFGPL
ncbi:hypothetical protein SLE2022_347550 [Rubroshorea leprosula]